MPALVREHSTITLGSEAIGREAGHSRGTFLISVGRSPGSAAKNASPPRLVDHSFKGIAALVDWPPGGWDFAARITTHTPLDSLEIFGYLDKSPLLVYSGERGQTKQQRVCGGMLVNLSFSVDQKGGIPIYIQIMDQIKHLIATGTLQPGQQLPTIRELAVDLTVNLHTVAHAYAELEREGFLSIQRGRGTFVTNGHVEQELADLRKQKLHALVESTFAEIVYLGYEPDDVVQVLDAHVKQWRATSERAALEELEE